MKSVIAAALFLLTLLSAGGIDAFTFQASASVKSHPTWVTRRNLQPGQGAELEACAYELMREFNENKIHGSSTSSSARGGGAVSWLLKSTRAWTSRPQGQIRNSRASKANTMSSSEAARLANHQP